MKTATDQLALFETVTSDDASPEVATAEAQIDPATCEPRHAPDLDWRNPNPDPAPLLVQPAITGTSAVQSFTEFYVEHGRVPMIQDERKPWTFRGWLMWYRLLAEDLRADMVAPRWNYWARTMYARKLLDEPIPRVEFDQAGESENSPGCKHVATLVDICAHELSEFNRIAPLLEWLLFAFGLSNDLPTFPATLHERLYRTLNLEHFLARPCDYFGAWIGASRGRLNPTAFFATPHPICDFMTRILFDESADNRRALVNEPAVGTGRMLLHASNYSLRLLGQDVDHTVVLACKINGALYAPWLVRPFPEEFFQ